MTVYKIVIPLENEVGFDLANRVVDENRNSNPSGSVGLRSYSNVPISVNQTDPTYFITKEITNGNDVERQYLVAVQGPTTFEKLNQIFKNAINGQFDISNGTVLITGNGDGGLGFGFGFGMFPNWIFLAAIGVSSIQILRKKNPALWGSVASVAAMQYYKSIQK